jgi:glycosyltransferase involved in cell wall biosynthesis
MLTIITPFQRKENIDLLAKVIKGHANWIVLIDDHTLAPLFPDWVTVKKLDKPPRRANLSPSNWLFNEFISSGLEPETQYMILCDDDSVEDGFFDKIPDKDVVITSMKRGDNLTPNSYGINTLMASPDNIGIGKVGGEQCIVKGKVLRDFRYGLNYVGDGVMVMRVCEEHTPVYVPDAYVLFNYFEDGRYLSFHRKPLVMFIGDYYCAANPKMGKSEWEGNISASIDSSGLADVLTFHFDKYFYHYNRTGDEALVQEVMRRKPDYIIMVYHLAGHHPVYGNYSVPSFQTLYALKNLPIVFIWGDLEDDQQRHLAKSLEPFAWKMIGTASKEVVEALGYTYMHVPKDSRIFNDPKLKRDIDVIFTGSVHQQYRPERYRVLKHIIDSGIKIEVGGSEGGDHYSTEDYARGYQRAKMAISFSKAGGMNVVNARVFEILSCGALLLEQKSNELAKLYTPGVDYVEWTDEVDLENKIRYYLEHEEERLLIANNGRIKTETLYSAKTFWSEILKR